MNKQTQRKKYKCEIVYQTKKCKYTLIQMYPFEHVAYNIVYVGLRVVSNDVTHIKGTL